MSQVDKFARQDCRRRRGRLRRRRRLCRLCRAQNWKIFPSRPARLVARASIRPTTIVRAIQLAHSQLAAGSAFRLAGQRTGELATSSDK